MADRSQRIGADAMPVVWRLDGNDRAHVDGSLDHIGTLGRVQRDQPLAGVGEDPLRLEIATTRASAWAKQRMPLPLISAREPSELYSTMRAA